MKNRKVLLEVDINTLERAISKLPLEDKIHIAKRLNKETLSARWDKVLQRIDQKYKKHPITDKEISQEVQIVRKKLYGSSR